MQYIKDIVNKIPIHNAIKPAKAKRIPIIIAPNIVNGDFTTNLILLDNAWEKFWLANMINGINKNVNSDIEIETTKLTNLRFASSKPILIIKDINETINVPIIRSIAFLLE